MTRPLRIAFCGEGNTDSRVLPIVIEKILSILVPVEPIDLTIDTQKWDTRRRFPEALVAVVQQVQPLYHLLVVHIDADAADDRTARERKVEPATLALGEAGLSDAAIVWAVPVQAVEAWLLVSSETFTIALTGNVGRTQELSLPRHPDRIHRDEAKRLFTSSIYQLLARTQRQRRRLRPDQFQDAIATELRLQDLRILPAFQQFEQDLIQNLVKLGYVVKEHD